MGGDNGSAAWMQFWHGARDELASVRAGGFPSGLT